MYVHCQYWHVLQCRISERGRWGEQCMNRLVWGWMICSDAHANNKGFLWYQQRTIRNVLVAIPVSQSGRCGQTTHCTRPSSVCWTTKWLERVRIRFERPRMAGQQQQESNRSNNMNGITYYAGLCVLLLLLESFCAVHLATRANVSLLFMSCHCISALLLLLRHILWCCGRRVTSKIASIANLTNELTRRGWVGNYWEFTV